MESTALAVTTPQPLQATTDMEQLKKEMGLTVATKKKDVELEKTVESILSKVTSVDPTNIDQTADFKTAFEQLGINTQRQAAEQNGMLQQQIKVLSSRSDNGGDVANTLVNLKMQVEELDPGKVDFSPGWFSRMLGHIPGVGSPLKRYFSKYESAQTVIDAILHSLQEGRKQLEYDNGCLLADQKRMRALTIQLERAVRMAQMLDERLATAIQNEADVERKKFMNEELMFPLRQRTLDLSQQLMVNQQGVLSIEVLVRNNKELIRGVQRAESTTVNALTVAVTVAIGLANQKITLDKITLLNNTTTNLIAQTARQLRTQGVEIQKQASSSMLDIGTLKVAFQDVNGALEDLSKFRTDALGTMKGNIDQMVALASEAQKTIARVESGNKTASKMIIDVDSQEIK